MRIVGGIFAKSECKSRRQGMRYFRFVLFLCPLLLWSEVDYRWMVSLWGGGNWHNAGYAFDLRNQWTVVPTALAIGSFGASLEYDLDEVWTVWVSGGYWPLEENFYLIGDAGVRWYGNWSAPLGPGIGLGVMAWGTKDFFALYPAATLGYKVAWGRFFVEPDIVLYVHNLSGYLGVGARVSLGWMW